MPRVIVVKLGTSLVTDRDRRPDSRLLADVARQAAELWAEGRRVAVVSSGAVGAGMAVLGLARRPEKLAELQAAAAAGQPALMAAWAAAFGPHGLKVGQVLVTRDDVDDRRRFLNVRETVAALWRAGAVPIINENDTVSTAELAGVGAASFGDNDQLAAAVTTALSAEVLVLLSTVAGVLDDHGEVVPVVADVAEAGRHLRPGTSEGGTGGLAGKLAAARLVTAAGEAMVLADGRSPDALLKAARGEPVGTRFLPRRSGRLVGRTRWIATAAPAGRLVLDAGAAAAVRGGRASLLPAGVVRVEGDFDVGDVVELVDHAGAVVGRGLCNYDSAGAVRVSGSRSRDLGGQREEMVHRDNLVLRG